MSWQVWTGAVKRKRFRDWYEARRRVVEIINQHVYAREPVLILLKEQVLRAEPDKEFALGEDVLRVRIVWHKDKKSR